MTARPRPPVQDTNGDVCMVDRDAAGRPFAVRGPEDISTALAGKQRSLAWHVLRQLLVAEAAAAPQGTDPDDLTPMALQLAEAARRDCERQAAAAGGSGASAMEIDGVPGVGAAAPPEASAAAAPPWDGMQSAAARDAHAVLAAPGFQGRFRAKALLLLRGYLRGAAGAARAGSSSSRGATLLAELLAWMRHQAAAHRVEASLRQQVAAHNQQLSSRSGAGPAAEVGPLSLRRLESGSELVGVWTLEAPGSLVPALVVVCEGAVRLEGSLGQGPCSSACRAVSRREVDSLLQLALQ